MTSREALSPLTLSEQIREAALIWGAILWTFPPLLILAYFARFESWPDLSFLIGGL